MELIAAISRARRFLDPGIGAPISEADTRRRVIDPLLRAIGYDDDDWLSEESGLTGRPDYTMLPATRFKWYIEAKRWGIPPDSRDVAKTLGYADGQGVRWVVLTNGEQWALYDNQLNRRSNPTRRKVAEASLRVPDELETFLQAMSKRSVTTGLLTEYVVIRLREERCKMIQTELRSRLESPTLHFLAALHQALVKDPLRPLELSREELLAAINALVTPTPEKELGPELRQEQPEPVLIA